ncbi:DNA-binding GntR family transcriptional regulator [Rhodopseudomonas julia]|uniref:DNA-binding GntR family transcriptional regulator n=1 Tax=Rhodopseudomonas julia TaxID=200617 RepID=A0ABU0C5U0_9BRAD|nr:GntR family transcriptional regulator [Rhodopseudomonas julia]MDQ0325553.1 DNA-binding GntR family transcriptional regulator [Rhodopseudomonas julia]
MSRIQRVVAPVRGQAEEFLRRAIEKGDLLPGHRLIEREICETLEVSRPLVREALRALESDGLVRPLPRGGIAVTVLTAEEAMQIYVVRREVEGLAASLFASTAGEKERVELQRIISDLHTTFAADDTEGLLDAKNRFYAALSVGSGNKVLQEMLRNLHGRIRLLRGTSLSRPGRTAQMVGELSEIADALLQKDAVRARHLTEAHIDNALRAAQEALQDTVAAAG